MTPNHFFRRTILVATCLVTLSVGAFAAQHVAISDKLLTAFQRTFPDATEVKWVEQPTGYMVSFKQNDIQTKVLYNKDGDFVGSFRYYSEKNLPVTVLYRLQKDYSGKTVFGVTEITNENGVQYYIKMQDEKYWYTILSDASGNLEKIEKYKKA